MSSPPMLIVTVVVSVPSWSNWDGLGPPLTFCGAVMSSVVAPLQLASRSGAWIAAATRWA